VRELAGHRDIKTTERYTRVFDADKRQHVATLSLGKEGMIPTGTEPK
jgi:integrase